MLLGSRSCVKSEGEPMTIENIARRADVGVFTERHDQLPKFHDLEALVECTAEEPPV